LMELRHWCCWPPADNAPTGNGVRRPSGNPKHQPRWSPDSSHQATPPTKPGGRCRCGSPIGRQTAGESQPARVGVGA
jgi:hypothetical protein